MSTLPPKVAHLIGPRPEPSLVRSLGSIPEALARAAVDFPGKGITLLDRAGKPALRRTYREMLDDARRVAALWHGAGVRPGDRVLIALPTSWEFITAWLGAVFLGAHPAAVAPAVGGVEGSPATRQKFENHAAVIGATKFLAPERVAGDLRRLAPAELGAITLTPEELFAGPGRAIAPAKAVADDLAFLQFTSGSTGLPRAVMIRHGMALHNALAMHEALRGPNDEPAARWLEVNTSWLPMHHDMGLIGCLILPATTGFDICLMNPTTFLGRPIRFIEAMHGKRTLTPAPNFGFQYCVDRLEPEALHGIDLSRLGTAVCGSEMIHPETMRAFERTMAPTGFRPEMIRACYGMAEATLAITFDNRGRGVRAVTAPKHPGHTLDSQEIVCVGTPVPETEVRIADRDGRTLHEDELGEILIQGPAVLRGYYRDEAATAAAIHDGWLRTGDLGFIRDGELYVAGRIKEILVIRGENIMPHEIEWLAEAARTDPQPGERVAAFAISRGGHGEEVALVVETDERDPEKLRALDHAIRSAVGRGLSLPIAELAFVRRGRIPRTSSGKIQRGRMREEFLERSQEFIRVPSSV